MHLTPVEARVLFTALHRSSAPQVGYAEFISGVRKLGELGGGERCRDCTERGEVESHLGGLVCHAHHKPRTTNG